MTFDQTLVVALVSGVCVIIASVLQAIISSRRATGTVKSWPRFLPGRKHRTYENQIKELQTGLKRASGQIQGMQNELAEARDANEKLRREFENRGGTSITHPLPRSNRF